MFIIYQNKVLAEGINSNNHRKNVTNIATKHFNVHHKVQSQQLPGHNIYFNEMKPIFIVMRLVGRFPYSFTKTGFAPFSLISWPFLYSLVFNLVFGVMTMWSIREIIRDKIYHSQSYEEILFWSQFLLFALLSYIGPITFWWDAPRTVKYFQKWKDFEIFWRCKAMYSEKRHRFTRIFSALITPLAIMIITVENLTIPKISILIFVPYLPIMVAGVLMLGYWLLTLHHLTQYSEQLLISMIKVKGRREMGYRRRIWLKISDLVTEIGNATGASGLSYASTYFIGFLLSVYGILISIAIPGSSSVSIWGLLSPAAYCLIANFLIVDAAYKATERIGPRFMKKLLEINLPSQQSYMNEVELLVNCLSAKSPVVEYLGFMKVTRNTFLHFMSSTVTYLIVIVQMKTHPKELEVNSIQGSTSNTTSFEELIIR